MTPNEKLILRDLELGPATVEELAVVVKINNGSTRRVLRKAKLKGLVRICSWERVGRFYYSVWAAGGGRDAPKPKVQPKESTRAYRARNREKFNKYRRDYYRTKPEMRAWKKAYMKTYHQTYWPRMKDEINRRRREKWAEKKRSLAQSKSLEHRSRQVSSRSDTRMGV